MDDLKLNCRIGGGAHGEVFLAEGAHGLVAVKVCRRPDDPARQSDWERERRGWRLFAGIPRHPGLVHVFGFGEAPGGDSFRVEMELADSESGRPAAADGAYRPLTLASLVGGETALPLRDCLSIGIRLASALEHLQRHHLLHRDIKPGNVLFIRRNPVIADAGLVVDVREAGSLVGTPGYVPPENHGTPQGDVFSLGRTLWRIATGREPDDTVSAPCAEADTSDPDFRDFLAIVSRAMSDAPERRYRSAKALRKALERLRRRRALRRLARIALPVLAATCAALLLALAWSLGRRSGRKAAGKPATAEDDPLEPLREGVRSGKIHLITPEEVDEIVQQINGSVNKATDNLQRSLPVEKSARARRRGRAQKATNDVERSQPAGG